MLIKEEYQILAKKEYNLALIDEINELKSRTIKEDNEEYLYRCNLLIADVYIANDDLDSALNAIMLDVNHMDTKKYPHIYLAYLDRLIYLYIGKRSYRIALRYLKEKAGLIDIADPHACNRLNLEYAYVFGELGDMTEAVIYFKKILASSPTVEMKSYVLSNLTKIFIDLNETEKAKEALELCPLIKDDYEGRVYHSYLKARIYTMEKKYQEALLIYQDIFNKEIVNKMTLGILNDYLHLANTLKKYQESAMLIKKMDPLIEHYQDLELKKNYCKNKLDYFLATGESRNAKEAMDAIDKITRQISTNDKILAMANFEEEKNELKTRVTSDIIKQIDDLNFLLDISFTGNSLREIFNDFGFKLNKILPLEEISLVILNVPHEKEYMIKDTVKLLHYKKGRLYEKEVSYSALNDTIISLALKQNKILNLDLSKIAFAVKDIFSGMTYDKTKIDFLSALTCNIAGDIFAVTVYAAKNYDLSDSYHSFCLKAATRQLEAKLLLYFANEDVRRLNDTLDFILNENDIGLFYFHSDVLYLSKYLKDLFLWDKDSIAKDEFIRKIQDRDVEPYLKSFRQNEASIVRYCVKRYDKSIEVMEEKTPIKDDSGNIAYYRGIIKKLATKNVASLLSQNDFQKRMLDLKEKAKDISFKFSLIKIKLPIAKQQLLKDVFNQPPYFMNDASFVVVLENEANQRTLERYLKHFPGISAVIRYPRDMLDIDEMIVILDLMLKEEVSFFTNEIYGKHIKALNFAKRIEKAFSEDLSVKVDTYSSAEGSLLYVTPDIPGLKNDDIYAYLPKHLYDRYAELILKAYQKRNLNYKTIIALDADSIYKIYSNYGGIKYQKVLFMLEDDGPSCEALFNVARKSQKELLVHYLVAGKIDPVYYATNVVKGIFIGDGNDDKAYQKALTLAKAFNLYVIATKPTNIPGILDYYLPEA